MIGRSKLGRSITLALIVQGKTFSVRRAPELPFFRCILAAFFRREGALLGSTGKRNVRAVYSYKFVSLGGRPLRGRREASEDTPNTQRVNIFGTAFEVAHRNLQWPCAYGWNRLMRLM